MAIYTLRTQMIAPVSVKEAFAVFEDPRNLKDITPPWLNFRITTPDPVVMKKGASFDYTLTWLGIPFKWQTLITEYEPPFLFVDEESKGPYTLWRHRHTFHPSEEGTVVTDEVDYSLPLGPIGDLAHRLVVANQLKEIFRFRQSVLNAMICASRGRWTEPGITVKESRSRL